MKKAIVAALALVAVVAYAATPDIPAQDQDAVYRALAKAHWDASEAINKALDAKAQRVAELGGAAALSDDQRKTITEIITPLLDSAIQQAVSADVSLESVYQQYCAAREAK